MMVTLPKIDFSSITERGTVVWQGGIVDSSNCGPTLRFYPPYKDTFDVIQAPRLFMTWDDFWARECGHAEEMTGFDIQTLHLVTRDFLEYMAAWEDRSDKSSHA